MLIFSPWATGKVIINIDIAKFSLLQPQGHQGSLPYNVGLQERKATLVSYLPLWPCMLLSLDLCEQE